MAFAVPAMAARGCNAGDTDPSSFIEANFHAPGKTYDGTVTLYYEALPNSDLVNMFYFVRIVVDKNTIVPFSGVTYLVDYTNIGEQQAAVENFLLELVVPRLFAIKYDVASELETCGNIGVVDCPPVALKSASQGIEDDQWKSELLYLILDFTIAIDY